MAKRTLVDWLELATGIAVLVGLGLVVMEIRVNTDAVNRQAAVDRASALAEPFFYSEEVRSALQKIRAAEESTGPETAFVGRFGMTDAEAIAWARHLTQVWMVIEADFYHGDSEVALLWARALLGNVDNRLFVENWMFGGEFQLEIDRILAATAPEN